MCFLIGGVQPRTVVMEKQARPCPFCAHTAVRLKRTDHYLSIFFIPLFRIKKGIPFLICENCNALPGKDIPVQRCGYCGKTVDEDFAYCPYCGKSI